jgi:hypothetical protein
MLYITNDHRQPNTLPQLNATLTLKEVIPNICINHPHIIWEASEPRLERVYSTMENIHAFFANSEVLIKDYANYQTY